jgi:hypothetical protein
LVIKIPDLDPVLYKNAGSGSALKPMRIHNTAYLYDCVLEGPVAECMERKLTESFGPSHLEILNESYMHSVPKGSETHFKVLAFYVPAIEHPDAMFRIHVILVRIRIRADHSSD